MPVETVPELPPVASEVIPEAILVESTGSDRRDNDRVDCHREAWLHPVTLVKDEPWHAIVLAISTGGISLAIERRILVGTFFAIELPDPFGGPSHRYAARVIHSEAQGHGYWHLGCAFAAELTDEQLMALV